MKIIIKSEIKSINDVKSFHDIIPLIHMLIINKIYIIQFPFPFNQLTFVQKQKHRNIKSWNSTYKHEKE